MGGSSLCVFFLLWPHGHTCHPNTRPAGSPFPGAGSGGTVRYVERKRKQQRQALCPSPSFRAKQSAGPGQSGPQPCCPTSWAGAGHRHPPPAAVTAGSVLGSAFQGHVEGGRCQCPSKPPSLWPWSPLTCPSLHPSQDSLSSGTTATIDTGVKCGSPVNAHTPGGKPRWGERTPEAKGRRRNAFCGEQLLDHAWPLRSRVAPLLLRQSPFCETLCALFPPPKGHQTPRASHCAYPANAGLGRRQRRGR